MDLYILDSNFNKLAMINNVNSVVWCSRFNDVGYCEIYTAYDANLIKYFDRSNYIMRLDDDMICKISSVEINTNAKDGDFITVNAIDCKSILNRRIVWNDVNFNGKVIDLIKQLLDDNVMAPKTSSRKILNFVFDITEYWQFPDTISIQISDKQNLLNLIISICKDYGYGFQIRRNEYNQFVFELLKTVDKSSVSSERYVEFSPAFANIISTHYKISEENYKNVVLVGGEKKDDIQTFADYGSAAGLERRELYIDSGISKTYKDDKGIEHTYTDEEYKAILINAGKLSLIDNGLISEFYANVDTIDTYEYKKDYNIGDIVKVVDNYGYSARAPITEVLESDDTEDGYTCEITVDWEGGN